MNLVGLNMMVSCNFNLFLYKKIKILNLFFILEIFLGNSIKAAKEFNDSKF